MKGNNALETGKEIFHSGFVSLIGRPNVGKSTLLNSILGQKIAITSNKPQTTRNRILGIHNVEGGQILFLDTPGIHKARGRLNKFMVDQALAACADVDVILFLVEANDPPGGGDEFIIELLSRSQIPVVLVINKMDLVPRERLLPLMATYAARFPFREIVPVSALTRDGLDDLVTTVKALLPEGPRYYPEDMVTDLPERFIVAEMVREQVLRQSREEVPYGVAVTVEAFTESPEKNLVVINAVIHVERDSHKRIVVGKGGARIRAIGQASRVTIERLLGCRVFLELFVKVQKNWTDSDRLLREFGYH
jgi:GTP-binding protein Era